MNQLSTQAQEMEIHSDGEAEGNSSSGGGMGITETANQVEGEGSQPPGRLSSLLLIPVTTEHAAMFRYQGI